MFAVNLFHCCFYALSSYVAADHDCQSSARKSNRFTREWTSWRRWDRLEISFITLAQTSFAQLQLVESRVCMLLMPWHYLLVGFCFQRDPRPFFSQKKQEKSWRKRSLTRTNFVEQSLLVTFQTASHHYERCMKRSCGPGLRSALNVARTCSHRVCEG